MSKNNRKLRVFLCHASQDKPIVRELYQRLLAEGWIDPWLDEEKLLPGQEWDIEIEKAVESSDVVIVCLSDTSVSKEGYIQRELKFVLDIALEKPEGTVFIIPLRLDDVQPPRRIRAWQYADYFPEERRQWAFKKLQQSLRIRFEQKTSLVNRNEIDADILLPSAISVETKGGIATPIFYKGEPLPVRRSLEFSTAEDNQAQVEIHIVLGGNKKASDNVSLGKFVFDGISPAPMGIPKIDILIEVSGDLKLRVTATDKNTNRKKTFDVVEFTEITPPSIFDPIPPKSNASFDGDFSDFFEKIFNTGFDNKSRKNKPKN